ncbi:MAG: hypothetical protein GOMPHAMPRED_000101 [Gomphillus americanus]|uniref:Uncharacterized protein n=1 Tax=Gomphillus americanus TaxID=1940652 RepID=A0A8H3I3G8_9LECA|nr:MAG: hypothetical protein GOMPHAMPRED_000101 [Gomphillus americanus]
MPTPTATPILLDGGLLLEEIEGVLVEVAIVLVDGVCEVIGAGVVVAGDPDTFQAQLNALRNREKAHTEECDAIAAARRRLPMVKVACEGCTFDTAHTPELSYLHSRDVTYAIFYQGLFKESDRYRKFMGWRPWL